MWTLITSEIKYNLYNWILIAALPVSFTLMGWLDIKVFQNIEFLKKYFWSALIGLGIYVLIFSIWAERAKELRDRHLALLPLEKRKVTLIRFFTAILPFIILPVYLELARYIINNSWFEHIERIPGQLGLLFIFIAMLSIIMDLRFHFLAKNVKYKSVLIISVFIILLIMSFGIIYMVTTSILPPLPVGEGWIYFYLWGLLIAVAAGLVFYKRESFLS